MKMENGVSHTENTSPKGNEGANKFATELLKRMNNLDDEFKLSVGLGLSHPTDIHTFQSHLALAWLRYEINKRREAADFVDRKSTYIFPFGVSEYIKVRKYEQYGEVRRYIQQIIKESRTRSYNPHTQRHESIEKAVREYFHEGISPHAWFLGSQEEGKRRTLWFDKWSNIFRLQTEREGESMYQAPF
jgi:hypothetical protein